jgi:hypothetical protein
LDECYIIEEFLRERSEKMSRKIQIENYKIGGSNRFVRAFSHEL